MELLLGFQLKMQPAVEVEFGIVVATYLAVRQFCKEHNTVAAPLRNVVVLCVHQFALVNSLWHIYSLFVATERWPQKVNTRKIIPTLLYSWFYTNE